MMLLNFNTRCIFRNSARRCTRCLAFIAVLFCVSAGLPSARAAKVEVIVNNALYTSGQIDVGLNQYLSDLQNQGYTTLLTTSTFANPAALRSHLVNQYRTAGLQGAVLIGDMPVEHFERNGQYGDPSWYERFPSDLYYMDLNGSWSDATGNGTYDTHTGNVAPEIWISHMVTSPLTSLHPGRTEASLLNSYFQKDHAYRTGQIRLPQNGLAYVDDDWASYASTWGNNLDASVAGGVTIVSNGATTTAADYKSRLAPSTSPKYESVLLCAHSNSSCNAFKIGNDFTGGTVWNSELADLNPQALFYNLFACSNANYEASGYMGGEYVFGTDLGLLAVGTTKTGSMLDFQYYYNSLGQGKTFAQSYLDWWNYEAGGGFSDYEKDWFYGMTLVGDPLLRTEAYMVPEPSSIMLLIAGLACGLIIVRNRRA